MDQKLQGRDIWVQRTNRLGKSWTSFHRVYDVGLFMAARQAEAALEGGLARVKQVLEPGRRVSS